jgi:hypothetical protein
MLATQQSFPRTRVLFLSVATALAACLTLGTSGRSQEKAPLPPVQVKIHDDKAVVVEPTLQIDPNVRVQYNMQGNMMLNLRVDQKMLHLGFIQTMFSIDGNFVYPGNPPGRMVVANAPLGKTPGGRARQGVKSVYEYNNLTITQIIEVVPTKPPKGGTKRRLDTAMIHYLVENKDKQPHKVGMRIFMDVFVVDNDGALFAAPNHPKFKGKVLDGIELKGKDVPDVLQFLQRPSVDNPGFVANMTYNFGRAFERPDRVVLTRLGAFADQWNLQAMPANGDSAMGFYWEPKEVKANSRRNMAYGFGEGIAPSPDGEGQMAVVLGGSFEPGKLFTISAYVQDPSAGQSLTLELPPGMERVEGKERQPVPTVDDAGNTMVLWKARVKRTGTFTMRVRSSTGVTQTKIITISRP